MVVKQAMQAEANDAEGMLEAAVIVCWGHYCPVQPDLFQMKEETYYEPLWKTENKKHNLQNKKWTYILGEILRSKETTYPFSFGEGEGASCLKTVRLGRLRKASLQP